MRSVAKWVGKTDDAAVPVPVKLRILARQSFTCACCSQVFTHKRKAEFHHVKSLESGGTHDEDNLEAWCRECHAPVTRAQAGVRAKVNRVLAHEYDLRPSRSRWPNRDGKYRYNWKTGKYEPRR